MKKKLYMHVVCVHARVRVSKYVYSHKYLGHAEIFIQSYR